MQRKEKIHRITNLIPLIGITIFVGLYIFSASLYPGGSQANLKSEGFDWIDNYWCNLMNQNGMNGEPNPAKPFSIFALSILCISLMVFFIRFARTYPKSKLWMQIISTCGVISMSSAILIFTPYHDLMTLVSSFFGLFVVAGIVKEIYRSNLTPYKIGGAACVILLGLNNYIYYSRQGIELLPFLQKITLIMVLIWIIGLNYEMNKKSNPAKTMPAQS